MVRPIANLTDNQKQAEYRRIVEEVKAEVRKLPQRQVSGAWVTWEIQRRWAERCQRPFEKPEPPSHLPAGVSTEKAPAPEPVDEKTSEGEPTSPAERDSHTSSPSCDDVTVRK